MAKQTKTTKRATTKTKAQWEAEIHVMQSQIDEHLRDRNAQADRAIELAAKLDKAQAELAKTNATAAHSHGEAEGLKLAMRMLANTIIGQETYQSWPWQAKE